MRRGNARGKLVFVGGVGQDWRMPDETLQERFCSRFNCPPQDYVRRAFRMSLYPHAKLILAPLGWIMPSLVATDEAFIRKLGQARSMRDLMPDLLNFQSGNRWQRTFLRKTLRLRVSGRAAARLAARLFEERPAS